MHTKLRASLLVRGNTIEERDRKTAPVTLILCPVAPTDGDAHRGALTGGAEASALWADGAPLVPVPSSLLEVEGVLMG